MSVRARVTRTAQASGQGDLADGGGRIGVGGGAYVLEGPASELRKSEDLKRAYLGR